MSNILFQTGFGHYTTPSKRFATVDTSGGSISIGAFGRNSTNGLRLTQNAAGNLTQHKVLNLLAGTSSTLYYAFAFKISSLPSTTHVNTLVSLWDVGIAQDALFIQSNGTLYVAVGTNAFGNSYSTLASSSTGVFPNVWYHVEWKIVINSSTGSTEVRLNEIPIINASGLNTKNGTASDSYVTDLAIGGYVFTESVVTDYDDIVVRSDTWSGDLQVKHFFPTGVGSTNAWAITGATFSYDAVDDSDPNDNTDYISTSNVGDTTLLTFGSLPTTSTIHAVVPLPWAEKTDAGTAKFASISKIGTTSYTGTDQAPSNGSYTYFPEALQTSPATGLTWTVTEFNSIEMGVIRTA